MLRISVVVASGVLVLSSCSTAGDPASGPTSASSDAPLVAPLEIAWQSPTSGSPFLEADDSRGNALWTTPDTVSLVTKAVSTYDVSTGDRVSTVPLDGRVCAVSRDVNSDGIGAVALGRGCHHVVAVDTRAGKVVGSWETGRQVYLQDVSVGEHVVVAADAWYGARRFDLRSGKELPTLGPGSAASDGALVVVATGQHPGGEMFEVYEQDSGRRVKTVAAGTNVDVFDILSDRPLLVAAHTNEDGNYVRDLSGRTATASGREIDESYPNLAGYQVLDRSLYVQYGGSPLLDAWDHAARGLAPYAVLRASEGLVGTHDGSLVTVETSGDPLGGGGSVVRALDPSDPAQPTVLGTAGADTTALLLSAAAEVVGDLLVTPIDNQLVALTLPDDGVPQSELDAASGLTGDDFTSADVGDLCPGLRPGTLAAVGIGAPRGGYRADCTFLDVDDDAYLDVSALASTADPGDDLDAVEVAEHAFADTVRKSGTNNLPRLSPLTGVGDQAAWGDGKSNGTGLLVRVDNVTLIVQGTRLRLTPGTSMEEALRGIGRDLVAGLERRH